MPCGSGAEEWVYERLPPLAAEGHVCEGCGICYAQTAVARAVEVIGGVPDSVRAAVLAVPVPARRVRPNGSAWSVTEYVCHLRDVYATYTIRLHRARIEDRPMLAPMLNDLRASRFRYNERAVSPVLDELASNAGGFCEETSRVGHDDWERVVTRLPGEQRTARWLVRQAMHEGVHHLGDIRTTGEAAAALV